jgi:hypothetical protein
MLKKWLGFGVGLLVSIGILALLIGSDVEAVKEELQSARYLYAIPFILLHVGGVLTRSIRWQVLLDQRIGRRDSFEITSAGYFLSGVLPLRLGDFARAWMTTRLKEPVPAFTSLSTVVVERLVDLLAVVGLLGVMLAFLDVPQQVATVGAVLGLLAFAGVFVLAIASAYKTRTLAIFHWFHQRIPLLNKLPLEAKLGEFLDGIQPLARPATTLKVIFWTTLSWLLSVGGGYVILFTLFDSPTLGAAIALTVFTALSVALPAVPGNLGPFEGATVGALWISALIAGVSAPENAAGIALGTLLHILSLGTYVVLGVYGLYAQQLSLRQAAAGAKTVAENENRPQKLDMAQESLG